jgi:hypothetical protein
MMYAKQFQRPTAPFVAAFGRKPDFRSVTASRQSAANFFFGLMIYAKQFQRPTDLFVAAFGRKPDFSSVAASRQSAANFFFGLMIYAKQFQRPTDPFVAALDRKSHNFYFLLLMAALCRDAATLIFPFFLSLFKPKLPSCRFTPDHFPIIARADCARRPPYAGSFAKRI